MRIHLQNTHTRTHTHTHTHVCADADDVVFQYTIWYPLHVQSTRSFIAAVTEFTVSCTVRTPEKHTLHLTHNWVYTTLKTSSYAYRSRRPIQL
jgi:hypothetical protein